MTTEKKAESLSSSESFALALNVPVVSMATAMNVVWLSAAAGTPTIIAAESASGKTDMSKQLARRNGMKHVIYHLAHCEPSDIRGIPFPVADSGHYTYLTDDRIVFAPSEEAQLIIFDEVNRAPKDTLNAVFPIWSSRMIGDHTIGENVAVIGLINPPGGGYSVTSSFTTDHAMRRRACMVVAKFSAEQWLSYASNTSGVMSQRLPKLPAVMASFRAARAEKTAYHKDVTDFLTQRAAYAYDSDCQAKGQVYACPSSWEHVSDLCYLLEHLQEVYNVDPTDPYLRSAISVKLAGHLNTDVADMFTTFREASSFRPDIRKMTVDLAGCTREVESMVAMTERGENNMLRQICELMATEMVRDAKIESQELFHDINGLAASYVGMMLLLPKTTGAHYKATVEMTLTNTFGAKGDVRRKFYELVARDPRYNKYATQAAMDQIEDQKRK